MAYSWRQSDWSGAAPAAAASPARVWTLAWIFAAVFVAILFLQDIATTRFTPWPSTGEEWHLGRDLQHVHGGQLCEGRLDCSTI